MRPRSVAHAFVRKSTAFARSFWRRAAVPSRRLPSYSLYASGCALEAKPRQDEGTGRGGQARRHASASARAPARRSRARSAPLAIGDAEHELAVTRVPSPMSAAAGGAARGARGARAHAPPPPPDDPRPAAGSVGGARRAGGQGRANSAGARRHDGGRGPERDAGARGKAPKSRQVLVLACEEADRKH